MTPTATRRAALLMSLWHYRGFILGSVQREFQARYAHSALGASWTLLQPLAQIVVYSVIFGQIMRSRLPGVDSTYAYSIYLCAGVLTWGLFADITTRSLTMFFDHANLLKKVRFPRSCLPLIVLLNAALSFAIVFALFTLFMLLVGHFPGWIFLALLPVLLLHLLLALGLGLVLGVLNVFFRDIGPLYGIVIQFWFWLTPVVYPAAILPDAVQRWLWLNPQASLMAAYQAILVHGVSPNWSSLWLPTLCALGLCGWGWRLFRRHAADLVDEL